MKTYPYCLSLCTVILNTLLNELKLLKIPTKEINYSSFPDLLKIPTKEINYSSFPDHIGFYQIVQKSRTFVTRIICNIYNSHQDVRSKRFQQSHWQKIFSSKLS